MSIQFEFLDADAVLSNVTPNGVRYLEIFLNEYEELTGEKELNAGCKRCIANYLTTFKTIKFKMKNTNKTQYVLKEKYNNIPLEFGSNIFVNNQNLTDKYAKKLLEVFEKDQIFEAYPIDKPKVVRKKPVKKEVIIDAVVEIPTEKVETIDTAQTEDKTEIL